MAAKYTANIGELSYSINDGSLAAAFGAGTEFALTIPNHGTPNITWQTSFAGGNPASITINLEASLDNVNWFVIDTSTSVTGQIRTVSGSYKFLRANNSAVAGGGGITLDVFFVYSNGLQLSNNFLPGLQYAKVTVPAASVRALLTTPFTLIPAVVGSVILPEKVFLFKAAGTAYTIVGITSFGVGVGSYSIIAVGAADFAGFLDNTAATVLIAPGNYNRSGASVTTINPLLATAALSAPVRMFTAGADPAVGDSDVTAYIEYRIWPVSLLN